MWWQLLTDSQKPVENEAFLLPPESQIPPEQLKMINNLRTISYVFPYEMLSTGALMVKSKFKNGSKKINNLLMIEKHFYKNEQIKEFEFG